MGLASLAASAALTAATSAIALKPWKSKNARLSPSSARLLRTVSNRPPWRPNRSSSLFSEGRRGTRAARTLCSGYLVESDGTKLWVDAGTGTLGPLQRYTKLEELDGIWISHLHADHSADLLAAFYALVFADIERAPIPLYGPPGIEDRVAQFLTNGAVRAPITSAFEVREIYDGQQEQVGSLTLTTRAVSHGFPAFALRVSRETSSLVNSGATATAGCRIVTHVGRFLTPEEAVIRARTEYDGPAEFAAPGMVFTVG